LLVRRGRRPCRSEPVWGPGASERETVDVVYGGQVAWTGIGVSAGDAAATCTPRSCLCCRVSSEPALLLVAMIHGVKWAKNNDWKGSLSSAATLMVLGLYIYLSSGKLINPQ
jgi:hypothetical protein